MLVQMSEKVSSLVRCPDFSMAYPVHFWCPGIAIRVSLLEMLQVLLSR